jgi:DNA-binding transcriptional MerR regulator
MNVEKAPDAFRTISEAAEDLGLEQHVLRFWETRFAQIKPLKRGGGRRYYRPDDVEFLRGLKHLLHDERYTIKGVQKIIKDQGVKAVITAGRDPSSVAAPGAAEVAPVRQKPSMPEIARPRPAFTPPPQAFEVSANASIRERLEAALAELLAARQVLASV